jgi:hypothetical protein
MVGNLLYLLVYSNYKVTFFIRNFTNFVSYEGG